MLKDWHTEAYLISAYLKLHVVPQTFHMINVYSRLSHHEELPVLLHSALHAQGSSE